MSENFSVYEVHNGDNLWKIAKTKLKEAKKANEKEVTDQEIANYLNKIAEINGLKDKNMLRIGQKISLPELLSSNRINQEPEKPITLLEIAEGKTQPNEIVQNETPVNSPKTGDKPESPQIVQSTLAETKATASFASLGPSWIYNLAAYAENTKQEKPIILANPINTIQKDSFIQKTIKSVKQAFTSTEPRLNPQTIRDNETMFAKESVSRFINTPKEKLHVERHFGYSGDYVIKKDDTIIAKMVIKNKAVNEICFSGGTEITRSFPASHNLTINEKGDIASYRVTPGNDDKSLGQLDNETKNQLFDIMNAFYSTAEKEAKEARAASSGLAALVK